MGKLIGKKAIITGAAGGIGQAIAEKFSNEGADVALLDMNIDQAKHNASKLIAEGKIAIADHINLPDTHWTGCIGYDELHHPTGCSQAACGMYLWRMQYNSLSN